MNWGSFRGDRATRGEKREVTDRQARDLPLDAHLHTDGSPDSDVAIDVYAAAAAERGVAELAITDHVDFEPGAPAYAYTTFADRERVVRQAAERWQPRGVTIWFGVELTYDRSWEGEIHDRVRARSRGLFVPRLPRAQLGQRPLAGRDR